jgi:hypothetical protein
MALICYRPLRCSVVGLDKPEASLRGGLTAEADSRLAAGTRSIPALLHSVQVDCIQEVQAQPRFSGWKTYGKDLNNTN